MLSIMDIFFNNNHRSYKSKWEKSPCPPSSWGTILTFRFPHNCACKSFIKPLDLAIFLYLSVGNDFLCIKVEIHMDVTGRQCACAPEIMIYIIDVDSVARTWWQRNVKKSIILLYILMCFIHHIYICLDFLDLDLRQISILSCLDGTCKCK